MSYLGTYILEVLCDDVSTIFVDGEEMAAIGSGKWKELATIEIPASTDLSTIGVKCHNARGGPYGIIAQVTDETGKVIAKTDNSWKCSNEAPDGWSAPDFSEAANWDPASVNKNHKKYNQNTGAWSHFPDEKQVIWTNSAADSVAYCRKDLPKLIGKDLNDKFNCFTITTQLYTSI